VALVKLDPGDAADHPFRFVGMQRTFRRNGDGTLLPIVNVTCASRLYDVQFTFTLKASTWDAGGGPPLMAERTAWVDEICGYRHVQGFYSEQDEGPDGIQYNYGVITVGTDDQQIENYTTARMDRLNQPQTFAAIDAVWANLVAAGAS
jgi:hypothetical protein